MSNPFLKEIFINVESTHQDDVPNPKCFINYAQEFVEAIGCLRDILRLDKISQHALDSTNMW